MPTQHGNLATMVPKMSDICRAIYQVYSLAIATEIHLDDPVKLTKKPIQALGARVVRSGGKDPGKGR